MYFHFGILTDYLGGGGHLGDNFERLLGWVTWGIILKGHLGDHFERSLGVVTWGIILKGYFWQTQILVNTFH